MSDSDGGPELSTADALQQWREAERNLAVARRGRVAAEAAAAHERYKQASERAAREPPIGAERPPTGEPPPLLASACNA